MEIVEINGNKWQKYKGDEGQDVYVAMQVLDEEKVLGTYVNDESYDILIDSDTDLYFPPEYNYDKKEYHTDLADESKIAFKFRKNVFTAEEQQGAFEGLFDAAAESHNRGLAAGPKTEKLAGREWVTPYQYDVLEYFMAGQPKSLDGTDPLQTIMEEHLGKYVKNTRGFCWLRDVVEQDYPEYDGFFPKLVSRIKAMPIEEATKFSKLVREKWISNTTYAAGLWSGIAGYYGRYPRIPYGRATAYTDNNLEQFAKCYPFARKLEKEFKRLLPNRHLAQQEFADRLDNKFLIGEDTTFTTITVNTTTKERNARMACHRDAGSLNAGYSNLTVVTKDNKDWKGGYLVVPEVRMAVNVRPGDLLLIDNMRVIHGNTPITAPDSGEEDMMRMSLVFYFREDMDNLGSWEYEAIRKNFVDTRRLNKDHRLWKQYWNGVSPNMFNEKEWYDFLEEKGGKGMVQEYHPEAYAQKPTLEGFFQ